MTHSWAEADRIALIDAVIKIKKERGGPPTKFGVSQKMFGIIATDVRYGFHGFFQGPSKSCNPVNLRYQFSTLVRKFRDMEKDGIVSYILTDAVCKKLEEFERLPSKTSTIQSEDESDKSKSDESHVLSEDKGICESTSQVVPSGDGVASEWDDQSRVVLIEAVISFEKKRGLDIRAGITRRPKQKWKALAEKLAVPDKLKSSCREQFYVMLGKYREASTGERSHFAKPLFRLSEDMYTLLGEHEMIVEKNHNEDIKRRLNTVEISSSSEHGDQDEKPIESVTPSEQQPSKQDPVLQPKTPLQLAANKVSSTKKQSASVNREALEGFLDNCSAEKVRVNLDFAGFFEKRTVLEKVRDCFFSGGCKKRSRPSEFDGKIQSKARKLLQYKVKALLENCKIEVTETLKNFEKELLEAIITSAPDCFVSNSQDDTHRKDLI